MKIESQGSGLLKVSFSDADPLIAKAVTARFADLFIQENTKTRTAIAQSSTEFLQHELDVLKGQLEVKERAIAQFKQSHLGQLPEQMDSNMRAIDRLENEMTAQQEMDKTLNLRLESVDKAKGVEDTVMQQKEDMDEAMQQMEEGTDDPDDPDEERN